MTPVTASPKYKARSYSKPNSQPLGKPKRSPKHKASNKKPDLVEEERPSRPFRGPPIKVVKLVPIEDYLDSPTLKARKLVRTEDYINPFDIIAWQ